MSHKLGTFLITTNEIPASSDAAKLFPLFRGSPEPVEFHYIQWYGGDSSEAMQLVLVPPTTVINGTTGPSDIVGTIAITPPNYMYGGVLTQDSAGALGGTEPARAAPRFNKFIVPPNYQIAMMQNTANTAAWSCTVGGFVLSGA